MLDFSQGLALQPPRQSGRPCIGLRIHARKGGILATIDAGRLEKDRRVAEVYFSRRPGHIIMMPPKDYDSWILGHVIFQPDGHSDPRAQCRALLEKLVVEIKEG
jgi:hypothetical protein